MLHILSKKNKKGLLNKHAITPSLTMSYSYYIHIKYNKNYRHFIYSLSHTRQKKLQQKVGRTKKRRNLTKVCVLLPLPLPIFTHAPTPTTTKLLHTWWLVVHCSYQTCWAFLWPQALFICRLQLLLLQLHTRTTL